MMRLRHLRLRSITTSQVFGADIHFEDGLNVIRAENSSGKSTALQSVIYALGLERSLGPHLTVPLPYAMRERIHATEAAPYLQVHQSYVELEIENRDSKVVTIRRDLVGGKSPKLIQTWRGAKLTEPDWGEEQQDFFIHDEGAAQREDGFHHFLNGFVGWSVPTVPRFDGSNAPLYVEAVFPMLFVEQKRGWSAVQGPFPTFLRIQDVARRVIEFLLDLDISRVRRARAQLKREISLVEQQWALKIADVMRVAEQVGRVRGIPLTPTADFAHTGIVDLEVYETDEWRRLSEVISDVATVVRMLSDLPVADAESAAPELVGRLAETRERHDQLIAVAETVRAEFAAESQDRDTLERRLRTLRGDLKRNQDALKLRRLGSALGRSAVEHVCPTCHQAVEAELMSTVAQAGMALEENIEFVRSQINLFEVTLQSSGGRLSETEARLRALEEEISFRQREIRTLRQSMLQPSQAPSRAKIEDIIRTQTRLDRLKSLSSAAAGELDGLKALAGRWVQMQESLKSLPLDEFSASDVAKIAALEAAVREHLIRYGFRSISASEIHVSRENFRLVRIEYDEEDRRPIEKELGFDISASDGIRLKWAYYLAMLDVSRAHHTNHPGLVFFDEPGQQQIASEDLHAFLRWTAAHSLGRQVVISTSEKSERVRSALDGVACNIVDFAGFILQPVAN